MNDSHKSHRCPHTHQDLNQEGSEDPGSRRLRNAACNVNDRRSMRV